MIRFGKGAGIDAHTADISREIAGSICKAKTTVTEHEVGDACVKGSTRFVDHCVRVEPDIHFRSADHLNSEQVPCVIGQIAKVSFV